MSGKRNQSAARVGMIKLKLEFLVDSKSLMFYDHSTSQLSIKNEVLSGESGREQYLKNIYDAFDLSGASILGTTFSDSHEPVRTTDSGWKNWFMSKVAHTTYFVTDTNFLMRHYASNVLFPLLGEAFNSLNFRIPRLVLMEVERRGNSQNKLEKRLAFYATKEIVFLRKNNAKLFEQVDIPLLTGFTEKAGRQLTDVWIRREVHDFIERHELSKKTDVLFLTCDLMNALAADAEGLYTCYFYRKIPEKPFFDNLKQVADFIMACSIIFERLQAKIFLAGDEVYRECLFEGVWEGKTPPDWYDDRLRITISSPSKKQTKHHR